MKVNYFEFIDKVDIGHQETVDFLEELFKDEEGLIFVNYPTLKLADMSVRQPDIFMISLKYGVFSILIDNIEHNRNGEFEQLKNLSETMDTKIYSDLLKEKELRKNTRELNFPVKTIMYLPNYEDVEEEDFVVTSKKELKEYIMQTELEEPLEIEFAEKIIAVLESTNVTILPKNRSLSFHDTNSKAYVLKEVEAQMARFDDGQRRATGNIISGAQRIRGLAGSGKTIILCLKAANLLVRFPDAKILYTFYTKSLYDYIINLISRFYRNLTDGELPDFENHMFVMHAWGGFNVPGVYFSACEANQVPFINYSSAYQKNPNQPFDYACQDFISQTKYQSVKLFDYVLIDEGQDFEPSFYQLCNSIVKDQHLVWAYDELQNIFDIHIQDVTHTFQNDFSKGFDLTEFGENSDIVLTKSYRNIEPILMWAVCAGFGIYNEHLIQSLENNSHWEDLGFQVLEGNCEKIENVLICRGKNNSPLKIPDTYEKKDFIEYYSFENYILECKAVSKMIEQAIFEEGLLPEDIVVICLDDRNAKSYFDSISEKLATSNISTYNLLTKNYIKGFQIKDAVTLTTVYKAKGNEAAMVFVIGCDAVEEKKDYRNMRNCLFTAFTRAKLWLRMTGVNILEDSLIQEYHSLVEHNYQLKFLNKPNNVLDRDFKENTKRVNDEDIYALEKLLKERNISFDSLSSAYQSRKR